MTVEAVCFDLDDTLFDYHDYARAGLRSAADRLAARTGRDLHDELEDLYFDAEVTEGTFDRLLERHEIDPGLIPELVEAYHDASTPLEPYDHAEALLGELTETCDLGLLTDGRGGQGKLDRLAIREYFDAVIVTPTIDRSKSETAVFERLLETLAVAPTAAVYVGDDPRVDFHGPNVLGMQTIRLRRGRYVDLEPEGPVAAPDVEIESLAALPEHLECESQ
jgi:putative hydrolase of the HAD superfamily